ncbi:MAG: rod shape-determining protein MreD [Christensenellales bacterium]|jgi:rod shape-determining protein MreD
MKRAASWTLLLLASIVLETVIIARYLPVAFRPDTIIAAITVIALLYPGPSAGFYGAAAGLLLDVVLSPAVGAQALAYFLTAQIIGFFSGKYYAKNWLFCAAAAFGARIVKEILLVLIVIPFGVKTALLSAITPMLVSAALTALICAPVYFLKRRSSNAKMRRARYE